MKNLAATENQKYSEGRKCHYIYYSISTKDSTAHLECTRKSKCTVHQHGTASELQTCWSSTQFLQLLLCPISSNSTKGSYTESRKSKYVIPFANGLLQHRDRTEWIFKLHPLSPNKSKAIKTIDFQSITPCAYSLCIKSLLTGLILYQQLHQIRSGYTKLDTVPNCAVTC